MVGARCAGAPLATLLARAGVRVCLVDRARFPSDTPSTHTIQSSGAVALRELGVLDALLRTAGPLERATIAMDDVRLEFDRLGERFGAPSLNVRRITLDAILLEAAGAAGAEVRTETSVTGLLEDGGRVAGVATTHGDVRARLVVGADGARSTVAKLVGAREYLRTPPGRVFVWGYFSGARADAGRLWFGKVGDLGYLASPTDGGLFMAAVSPSIEHRDAVRGDRERALRDGLEGWPELAAALAGATQVGPIRMLSRWHGFFREAVGPGWALVGDAGHFKDPTPGQGIADALRQAKRLARAIEDGSERALADWWAWRDADAREMYWFAHDLGAPGPTPLLVRATMGRIAGDPALADGVMRVLNHDVAPSRVLTPRLALATTARALVSLRGRRRAVLAEAGTIARDELRRRYASSASRRSRKRRSGSAWTSSSARA